MTALSSDRIDDRDVLARITAGDAAALEAWFHRHKAPLYSFIYYRVGGDADLAADATQAAFTTALENFDRFDPDRGDMITWLRTLSRNIIRDLLARHRRGVRLQAVWERIDESLRGVYEAIDSELLPDAVLEREETRELVEMALSNLPPQYREVLEAKYVDSQSLEIIAQQRASSVDSVKSMLRRARAAFRECFLTMAKMEMSDV